MRLCISAVSAKISLIATEEGITYRSLVSNGLVGLSSKSEDRIQPDTEACSSFPGCSVVKLIARDPEEELIACLACTADTLRATVMGLPDVGDSGSGKVTVLLLSDPAPGDPNGLGRSESCREGMRAEGDATILFCLGASAAADSDSMAYSPFK